MSLRRIKKGDELTVCYVLGHIREFVDTAFVHMSLRLSFGFVCKCEDCRGREYSSCDSATIITGKFDGVPESFGTVAGADGVVGGISFQDGAIISRSPFGKAMTSLVEAEPNITEALGKSDA